MFTQDYSTPTFPKVEEKPFTTAHFTAWLTTLDPALEYDKWSTRDCIVCQYGKAHGVQPEPWGSYFGKTQEKFGPDQHAINEIAYGSETNVGAALTRARALAGRK